MNRYMLLVKLFVWLFMMSVVQADTFNCETSGLWHVSSTWDKTGYPQEADDAIIENGYVVSMNQDAHAELVSVNGATLNAADHTLVVDSSTDLYGGGYIRNGLFNLATFNLSNGTAEDGIFDIGTFNLSGGTVQSNRMDISNFNWTGGRINDSQINVVDGTFDSSSTLYLDNSPLRVTGTFSQGNTGMIRLYGVGSIITNQGIWQLTNDAQPFDSTGSFVNDGTFRKSGGTGSSKITVPFTDNAGTVQVDSGGIYYSPDADKLHFSNTIFNVASGAYVLFYNGGYFNGDITGSGGGSLSLGGGSSVPKFYFTNSSTLNMGSGMINWNTGQFEGDITTLSPVVVRSTGYHIIKNSRWIAKGGVSHTSSKSLSLNNSVLEIPTNTVYDLQTNGTLITASNYGWVDLAGTISKTAGGDWSTISAPVHGDGVKLNITTGKLSLVGNCQLKNFEVTLATNTTWRPRGINSNVTVSADGKGGIHFYNSGVTAAGVWSLTNTDMSVYFYSDGDDLYVTPSLTLEGENSRFRFSKGQIHDGIITNRIPFEITSSGGSRYITYCHIHSYADTDFYRPDTLFQHSTWHNYPGVEHRMNVDGEIFGPTDYSTYYNAGTIRKSAGDGVSGTNIKLIDTAGTIAVDTGTLWLSSYVNEFRDTSVEMAAGTIFRMAGSICSNMTISAAGSATVRVASDGYDQTINSDLTITGPVKVELVADDLEMHGAITGAEANFEWRGGKIKDSKMTNAVPALFSGTATRWVTDSQLTLTAGAVHTNAVIYILRSAVYNVTGSVYQVASDGDILRNSSYGYFRNHGIFIKTGGNGTTDINAIFQNQEGTVGAERGLLRFSAALDLTNGALQIALGGVSDYGRVQSTAAVDVNGSLLTVSLRDGYTPVVGDSFTILTGSPLVGRFAATNLPALAGGDFWNLDYSSSTVKLTVASPEDTDGDLLKDSWEIAKFGSITNSNGGADNSDSDTVTDYHEYIADTDPVDGNSYFHISAVSNKSSATVYFNSSSNRLYGLYGRSSLLTGDWSLITGKKGAGGADSIQDTNSAPFGFYRLSVELP